MESHVGELSGSTGSACKRCGQAYSQERKAAGYATCLQCGELEARKVKHTIVPMHKSNYVVIRDLNLLKGINTKRQP